MTTRLVVGLAVAFLAVALLVVSRPAEASPTFPDVVRDDLGLADVPPCTDCHADPNGGFGTATTPFATYLRSRGLRARDTDSLRAALAAAAGERHDSNGDGVADVDELKSGRDPNSGAGDVRSPPKYGCGARIAPASSRDLRGGFALVALVALVAVGVRARRRTGRPSGSEKRHRAGKVSSAARA